MPDNSTIIIAKQGSYFIYNLKNIKHFDDSSYIL